VSLAYSLVDQLPRVAVAPRPVSARLLDLIEENFSAVFAELATYLPEDEAPRFATPNDTTTSSPPGGSADSSGDAYPYSFSQSQIEVIVGALVSAPLPEQTATLLSAENGRLTARMSELQLQLDALTTSRSWRYTRILRASLRVWRGRNRRSEP
jgi:hypothetical protein